MINNENTLAIMDNYENVILPIIKTSIVTLCKKNSNQSKKLAVGSPPKLDTI